MLLNVSNNEWIKGEIVRLFLLGFSQDKISKEVNVSIGSVNSILNEALSHDNTLELQR
jgi:DNA-directed RNA polymerase specialized sigma24 family protein